ncbi:hypothetical protein PV328_009761 [Microctonus aethiopoides]|uniref:Uncharacterized protein n=1 Tax=Microctonus aethiopoides TaxID=144406 RepID=A0AA39C7E2_9HYME|nr:hypothetical protein PV328_009761 [Microctonus aethiopoides]
MTIKRVSVVGGNEREETSDTLYIVTAQFNDNVHCNKIQIINLKIFTLVHTMFFTISIFLQTEAGPWGHLSPSLRSPTRPNSALSPGAFPSGSQHFNPSPTSPAAPGISLRQQRPDRQHRGRTSSMPAVPRHRPMLAETKRGIAGGGVDDPESAEGVEYYRLRSFSITANGVFNLGDSLKSRRSRSINSVTSSGTSCSSTRDARLLSSASQQSCIETEEAVQNTGRVATYKVGMLGAAGVGKTALTAQFTTSEYICAYDASLDDEYGQKSVSVMIDGQETDLEIIDHPASEMAVESFCATYNPDVYVVVYSVVDRQSLTMAEETLLYLWKSDYMATHGVILVGNKVDLERKREVTPLMGRRLANSCGCKFIETSSGLAHHVDELLVGILAQIKLNPQRDRDQATRRRRSKHRRRILKHLLGFKRKTKSSTFRGGSGGGYGNSMRLGGLGSSESRGGNVLVHAKDVGGKRGHFLS